MEAFDTWMNPGISFTDFKLGVLTRNPKLNIGNNVEAFYTTHNGNRIRFVIWNDEERDNDADEGARVLGIDYAAGNPSDTLIEAGNNPEPFLSGNVMTSPKEAVVVIRNPSLGTTITLDMSDKWKPRRTDENGVVEQAGSNHEVWVDFEWIGASEGDFYRPFKTLAAAAAAVADGGVIKIMPGTTTETPTVGNKRMTLVAPIGGVSLGIQ